MNEFDELIKVLEDIRAKCKPRRAISKKSQKMLTEGYNPVICLCNDGIARGIYPGESLPGTNVVPIPKKGY